MIFFFFNQGRWEGGALCLPHLRSPAPIGGGGQLAGAESQCGFLGKNLLVQMIPTWVWSGCILSPDYI